MQLIALRFAKNAPTVTLQLPLFLIKYLIDVKEIKEEGDDTVKYEWRCELCPVREDGGLSEVVYWINNMKDIYAKKYLGQAMKLIVTLLINMTTISEDLEAEISNLLPTLLQYKKVSEQLKRGGVWQVL